ncbi:unnamed protein product [Durusdinium trenchii]|uniref:SH3 domain-containing protein n=1 Tax=Durusdinium trenchii TaxID=1381693 RepID=A0ABP0KTL1_9DINO
MTVKICVLWILAWVLEAKVPGEGLVQVAGLDGADKDHAGLRQVLEEEASEEEGAEVASEGSVEEGAELASAEGEGALEEGAEEGEEEEEEIPTEADSEVAYMLLGAVIFVVSMFYLVNWNDDDIRYYSMNIISMTMSIFSAVLMYQGINEQITRFTEGLAEMERVVIQFVHCAIYIVSMQIFIGYFSGVTPMGGEALNFDSEEWIVADGLRSDFSTPLPKAEVEHVRNKLAKKSVWIDHYGVEVAVAKEKVNLMLAQRRMRCWAMLLAHMSGFAAINAGAHLQAVKVFSSSPVLAFLPAIINQVVLQIFFKIASLARAKRMEECIKNEGESGFQKAALCHEAVIEAENDVSSLSLSFLSVQVIRFIISGVMPNAEGEEEPPVKHHWATISGFFGLGVVAVILAVVTAVKCTNEEEEEEGHHSVPSEPLSTRIGSVLSNSLAMTFAWILLFGTKWFLFKVDLFNLETMIGQICHALALSIICGVAVFALDFVDDSMRGSEQGAKAARKAIRVIIQAIAILIGFSWEHCFDAGVADVSFITPHKRTTKFFMGIFVCIFLVPAWRRHILTKVLAYEDMKKNRAHAKKNSVRRSVLMRKQESKYELLGTKDPMEAQVTKVSAADMETGRVPKDAFLKVAQGDKVIVKSMEQSDYVWAEIDGKEGILPRSWLMAGGKD